MTNTNQIVIDYIKLLKEYDFKKIVYDNLLMNIKYKM